MAEKRYYWLKLQDGFFDSKRIKKLRKIAGGDTYTIIYLKMQLLAMKHDGVLEYSGLEDSFAEELSLDLNEDSDNVKVTVNYLLSCGLLETADNREFFVPFAVENTGSEGTSAKRVRQCREKQALQCNSEVTHEALQCNSEVTHEALQRNGEKEKEKEIEKESPHTPLDGGANNDDPQVDEISSRCFSPELESAVRDWVTYKNEKRQGYKPMGLRNLLTTIKNNVDIYGEPAVIALMSECMASNWQGIMFDRLRNGKPAQPPAQKKKLSYRIEVIDGEEVAVIDR